MENGKRNVKNYGLQGRGTVCIFMMDMDIQILFEIRQQ
jgi:hypothetical protein